MLRVDPESRINIDQVCKHNKVIKRIKQTLGEESFKEIFENGASKDVFGEFQKFHELSDSSMSMGKSGDESEAGDRLDIEDDPVFTHNSDGSIKSLKDPYLEQLASLSFEEFRDAMSQLFGPEQFERGFEAYQEFQQL